MIISRSHSIKTGQNLRACVRSDGVRLPFCVGIAVGFSVLGKCDERDIELSPVE